MERAEIEGIVAAYSSLRILPRSLPPDSREIPDDDEGLLHIEAGFCTRMAKDAEMFFTELFETAGCFGPDHVIVERNGAVQS
jgi:hypothetical protein